MKARKLCSVFLVTALFSSCAANTELIKEYQLDGESVIWVDLEGIPGTSTVPYDQPQVEIVYNNTSTNSSGSMLEIDMSGEVPVPATTTATATPVVEPYIVVTEDDEEQEQILQESTEFGTGLMSMYGLLRTLGASSIGKSVSEDSMTVTYNHKDFTEVVHCYNNGAVLYGIVCTKYWSPSENWKNYVKNAVLVSYNADDYAAVDLPFTFGEVEANSSVTVSKFKDWALQWKSDDVARYFVDAFNIEFDHSNDEYMSSYWKQLFDNDLVADLSSLTSFTSQKQVWLLIDKVPDGAYEIGSGEDLAVVVKHDDIAECISRSTGDYYLYYTVMDLSTESPSYESALSKTKLGLKDIDESLLTAIPLISDYWVCTYSVKLDGLLTSSRMWTDYIASLKEGNFTNVLDYFKSWTKPQELIDVDTTSRVYDTTLGDLSLQITTFVNPLFITNMYNTDDEYWFRIGIRQDIQNEASFDLDEFDKAIDLDLQTFSGTDYSKQNFEREQGWQINHVGYISYVFRINPTQVKELHIYTASGSTTLTMEDLYKALPVDTTN